MLVRGSPRCCLRRTDFVAVALLVVRLACACRRRGWLGPISRRWILVLARAPDLTDLEAREVRLTQGITAALRASLRPAGGFTVEAPSFGLLCCWWALCVAVVRCDGVRLAYATTGGMGPCSSTPPGYPSTPPPVVLDPWGIDRIDLTGGGAHRAHALG